MRITFKSIMGALENTLKMLFRLKTGVVVKKQELAQELEVSEKQIARYKRTLDSVFTIETIPGPLGGYKLVDIYFPFKELLTNEEIELLKYYSKSLQYISNEKIGRALDKINYSILNNKSDLSVEIIPYSRVRDDKNISEFEKKIYEAILDKKEIIISYKSNKGIITRRKVQPFKLFVYKGEYYLIAKCLTKNEIRYFKLTRIKYITVTSFKFINDFDVDLYLKEAKENSLGIFFEKGYDLRLIVHPPMANTISERIWVDNQVITELEDGSILFEATMKGGPEIVSWILSMQSCVEVLGPQPLKEELKIELEKMIKNLKV